MKQLHLAPLKNISCWAFRATAIGATDSYTHMINLRNLLSNKPNALKIIDTYPIPSQNQWIQILTKKIRDIAELPSYLKYFYSKYPERANIYGVNLNFGCPDPNVIGTGEGAALIKRTKHCMELIQAFLNSSDSQMFHISAKFRLGLNEQEMKYNKIIDFLELVKDLDDPRFAPTIIHFKHAKQSSVEPPHWEFLKDILNLNTPIIINGHINTPDDVKKIKENFSLKDKKKWKNLVAGYMIGRGAMKNLDCFQNFIHSHSKIENENWKIRFQRNIKTQTPPKRFLSNFYEIYPFLFKKVQKYNV